MVEGVDAVQWKNNMETRVAIVRRGEAAVTSLCVNLYVLRCDIVGPTATIRTIENLTLGFLTDGLMCLAAPGTVQDF